MAGSTPQQPFGSDPWQLKRARNAIKSELRAQKSQRRAEQQAYKAQRALYRQEARTLRRSSLLVPLLVLGLGVVLLLLHAGRISTVDFASWYGRWWPLLLVFAGLVLMAEWGIDQVASSTSGPRPRRSLGGGTVLLLIILCGSGAASSHLRDQHGDLFSGLTFGINSDDLDQFIGEKHESSESLDAQAPVGSTLLVNNPHGDVTITGGSNDNQVHVTVAKQVYSSSDSDADRKAKEITPTLLQKGTTLELNVPTLSGGSADLNIIVPEMMATTVNSNHGDVDISNLRAAVTVTANHGDIKLDALQGSVSAHINHRDASLSAHGITGDVDIKGHGQDMSVTDVSGQTSLEGEFYGDTHLEHLHGPVSFHTSRTQLSFAGLEGELDISPKSELTGSEIVGPSSLTTRSRNISLTKVAGSLNVTNSDGSVTLTAVAPAGGLNVQNRNGEVDLTIPERQAYYVDAQTRGGDIDTDLTLNTSNAGKTASASGSIGPVQPGSPRIDIRTTHLNISLHRGAEAPGEPEPGKPAAPPR